ncbi:hypothetical protein B0H65DRAFT_202552 [Neurospora tetraspora]|uniref:Uncharacterized protein n=1 Tax=Neurospora tetraspora TaxID=94610 RepID=A0AAE0JFE1_9PEZI|nr:hypothetical protein B0H65DRAFT_202552 [Neurospora tetraspora]
MGCHVLFPLPGASITHTLLASFTYPMRSHHRKPMSLVRTRGRGSTCLATYCPCLFFSLFCTVCVVRSKVEPDRKDGPITEVYKTPRLSALSSTPVVLCFHSLPHISGSPFLSIPTTWSNSQYKIRANRLPSAHPYIWLAPHPFIRRSPP